MIQVESKLFFYPSQLEKKATPNRPLAEALETLLDEEDNDLPYLVCYHYNKVN